jgi:pyrroline-5-carboxylate reductase
MATVGILGVGHFATYLVRGLCRSGLSPMEILLSPRGAATAASLAREHGVTIATDNQALVRAAGTVVLAVRPLDAVAAVGGLPWRSGQRLLSVCAGVRRDALAAAAPGAVVIRAMPISAAAHGLSPTPLFPDDDRARHLLARLGPVLAIGSEAEFETACVTSSLYGWVHELIGRSAQWLTIRGVDAATARALAARTFIAAGHMVASETDLPVDALVRALATPGGTTEQGLDELGRRGVDAAWDAACERTLARIREFGDLARATPPPGQ